MSRVPTDENPSGGTSFGLTSPSAVSADPPKVNDYDGIAEAYAAENEARPRFLGFLFFVLQSG